MFTNLEILFYFFYFVRLSSLLLVLPLIPTVFSGNVIFVLIVSFSFVYYLLKILRLIYKFIENNVFFFCNLFRFFFFYINYIILLKQYKLFFFLYILLNGLFIPDEISFIYLFFFIDRKKFKF